MKDFINNNSKPIIYSLAIIISCTIVASIGFSRAASTEGDTIYTRDELSDLIHEINSEVQTEKTKTNTIQSALNSLTAYHEDDIRWVDIRENVNMDVVQNIDEYVRYSIIGNVVILDIGGLKLKNSGMGQEWLTLPDEIIPRTRCVQTLHNDSYGEYTALVYNTIDNKTVCVHSLDVSYRFFGQMIWLID